MVAWERFLDSGEMSSDGVRNLIESSWRRCHSAHIDPGRTRAPDPLSGDAFHALQQRYRDLVEASVPIMAQARDLLSESGTMMILTDPTGVILQQEGDPPALEAALDVRLTTGANWSELSSGTNAIGTALSSGQPVQVHAAEHFCVGVKSWTCSATLVRDPTNGEVLGVLDISGLQSSFNRHCLALAVSAAGRIEARLTSRDLELRQRLLDWGLKHMSRVASGGLIFFDRKGRLNTVDDRAGSSLASLGLESELKAHTRIEAFAADSPLKVEKPNLPAWLRAEWVEPVFERGERLGTIVVLPAPLSGTGRQARLSAEELTASIAHEINQPIAAVVANAGVSLRLLAQSPPDLDMARECLEQTLAGGVRAGEIVKRIRDLVKKSPPRKDWVDVNKTILEVIDLTRGEIRRHNISLNTQLSADLPLIRGDRIQLQQVIVNLFLNAVDALSGLTPTDLGVSSEKDGSDGVLVSVLDSGRGFEKGDLDRLFEAYYTTKPDGMGMGLAISRSIISAHGGRLWARANTPRGAVFQFTLPRGEDTPSRES
jgi:signal transduction histidine kinase